MATRDALRGLALQFETWDFVGTRERDARRKRESADAVAEALRTFQLCASPKLRREENVDRVLVPVLRNFCARLLARVGRVVDRGVSADVDRVARGVRADIDAARGALGALGDLGELELAAAIERRLLPLADDLLAGWKGAEPPIPARAVPRSSSPSPSPSPSLDNPVDDPLDARFATLIADEALSVTTDCAAAVTPALTTRENVHNLMTPRVLGFAQRVVFASGGCDELPGEALEAALDACERLAAAAEAAAPRTHARAPEPEPEPGFEPARERRDGGGFFGIAALAALAAGGGGEDSTARDDAREAAASLRRVVERKLPHVLVAIAPKLRAAAEEATRRAERRRSRRRAANDERGDADAAAATLDASGSLASSKSSSTAPSQPSASVFAVSREEAIAAVRACVSPRECASTLAEGPVRAALAPVPAAPTLVASAGTPLAARVVAGDQTARDWTREPEGFILRVRRAGSVPGFRSPGREEVGEDEEGWTSERICTGPFQAHFTSACGALAEAIRDAGTCRRRKRERRAAGPASRWMAPRPGHEDDPGVSERAASGDSDDAFDDAFDADADAAACAAASARVMLASSRTVRGGDALRLVLSLFPGADPNDRDRDGDAFDPDRDFSWIVNAVDPKEAERALRLAGPATTVSVSSEGVEIVARDVFFVARVAPGEVEAEPWTALATKTTQRLAPRGEDGRLTLTEQAAGLDPDAPRAALDAFVRERGGTKTVPGRRELDEETRAAVVRASARRATRDPS